MNKSDAVKLLAQQTLDDMHVAAENASARFATTLDTMKSAVVTKAEHTTTLVVDALQTAVGAKTRPSYRMVSDWRECGSHATVTVSDGPDYDCTFMFRVRVALDADIRELRKAAVAAAATSRRLMKVYECAKADKPAARAKILGEELTQTASGKAVLDALASHRNYLKICEKHKS